MHLSWPSHWTWPRFQQQGMPLQWLSQRENQSEIIQQLDTYAPPGLICGCAAGTAGMDADSALRFDEVRLAEAGETALATSASSDGDAGGTPAAADVVVVTAALAATKLAVTAAGAASVADKSAPVAAAGSSRRVAEDDSALVSTVGWCSSWESWNSSPDAAGLSPLPTKTQLSVGMVRDDTRSQHM
jgi:hypothetical protein